MWQKLQESERSRGELQSVVRVVEGELKAYQQKVAGFESTLLAKDKELQKQTAALEKKTAAAQHYVGAQVEPMDRAK